MHYTRALLLELKQMKDLHHDHLTRWVGACLEEGETMRHTGWTIFLALPFFSTKIYKTYSQAEAFFLKTFREQQLKFCYSSLSFSVLKMGRVG